MFDEVIRRFSSPFTNLPSPHPSFSLNSVFIYSSSFLQQAFMEDVKSRGPFIYSVLESAQAFLAQHPFQEPEETLTDGKGLLPSHYLPTAATAKMSHSFFPSELILLGPSQVKSSINCYEEWSVLWHPTKFRQRGRVGTN